MAGILDILGQSRNNSLAPAGGSGPSYAPTAPVPGTSSNPFAGALASDAPGLLGILGTLAGNPTRDEQMISRMGVRQQQGLSGLEQRLQHMPMQQAIVDFLGSPEGQQFFTSSQDPIGALRGYMATVHPAPSYDTVGNAIYDKTTGQIKTEAPYTLSPGQQHYNGDNQLLSSADPLEVQVFKDTTKLANLDPAQTQDFARAMLNKDTMTDTTVRANAIKQLVARGIVTQDWANKYQSGMIQVQPTYDAAHNPNGVAVVDLSKMMLTGNPQDAMVVIAGSQNGGSAGYQPGGTQTTPEGQVKAPPGDIIFGAGITGNAAHTFGDIFGNINPKLAAPDYNSYKTSLQAINAKVNDLASGNSRLAQTAKTYLDLVDKDGWASNPIDQGTALLQLHDFIDRNLAYDNAVLASSDPRATVKEKADRAQERDQLMSLQQNLPTRESLNDALNRAMAGEGSVSYGINEAGKHVGEAVKSIEDTANQAIKTGSGAASEVTGSGGTNQPPDFKTEQEAAAARKAGTIQNGSRITIGGKPATWKD